MKTLSISLLLWQVVMGAKYPNEIVDTPLVICEPERILIKVVLSVCSLRF